MNTSVEATGKNIEQAIENALFELKAPREDVDIKIISEGGLFKKAKVKVSISEDCLDKYQKHEKVKEELKQEKPETKPEKEPKTEKKALKKEEKLEKKEAKEELKQEKKALKTQEDDRPTAKEFIEGVVKILGKDCVVSEIEEDEIIRISVEGEDLSELIGYRGEALFALSYLMTTIAKRANKRQVLDVCGYREKRAEALKSLAERMAAKVAKSGRYVKLEPMDASERRQIHLALQDNDKVTTMSKGTEPNRFVMIFPREYKD